MEATKIENSNLSERQNENNNNNKKDTEKPVDKGFWDEVKGFFSSDENNSQSKSSNFVSTLIDDKVKNAVDKTIESRPEISGAIKLADRINSIWEALESSKATQAGIGMSIGGFAAGALVYNKTESVTDTLIVATLSAAIVGSGFQIMRLEEESEDKTLTKNSSMNLRTLLSGFTGLTLTGGLSYKIYQIFEENYEAKSTTLQTIADVLMAVAAFLGLVGVIADPALINSIVRTTSSITKSIEQVSKLPSLLESLVDKVDNTELVLHNSKTKEQWDDQVKRIIHCMKNHNSRLEWFDASALPFVYITLDEFENDDQENCVCGKKLDEVVPQVDKLCSICDAKLKYLKTRKIGRPPQDYDASARPWYRLKIEPEPRPLYNAMMKSYLKGDFEFSFKSDVCSDLDFVDDDNVLNCNTVNVNYKQDNVLECDDWLGGFKKTVFNGVATVQNKLLEPDVQKFIGYSSLFVALIAAVAGSVYHFSYSSKIKKSRKERKSEATSEKDICSCGKDKLVKHPVCKECYKGKPASKVGSAEAKGAKRAAGKGSRTKMRQLNADEIGSYGNKRYELNRIKDELDDLMMSAGDPTDIVNQTRFGELVDMLHKLTNDIGQYYTLRESSELTEDALYIKTCEEFINKKGYPATTIVDVSQTPSAEAKPAEPSTKEVKQHVKKNVGETKSCVTCKNDFTDKSKLVWCKDCRVIFGKEKHTKTVSKPDVDTSKPSKTVKGPKQPKKCKCGEEIHELRYDICSKCYIATQPKVAGPVGSSVTQAASKYKIDYADSDRHKCMVSLFSKNSVSSDEYFGVMAKLKKDGKSYWVVNKHQLTTDTYYKDQLGKSFPLKPQDWSTFKELGKDSIYSLPAEKIQLPGISALPVGAIGVDRKVLSIYGVDPSNMKQFICATDAEVTSDGYIAHSVSTANNFCGAVLFDSQTGCVVGLHCRTNGPSTHGWNNFAVPLF